MTNYIKIGKLVATYGFKGDIVLHHSLGKKTALKGLESVFVEQEKDSFLPYFIEEAKIKNDEQVYLKFEGIESKEDARPLVPKEVWLAEPEFKKYAKASAPISMLGYTIVDDGTELGEIEEVIEQPHQLLCKITYNGKEALIPIHEEFLDKIDKKNKKIHVFLPDGLLDLYNELP